MTIKLEVGKKYRNRTGKVVEIVEYRSDLHHCFLSVDNSFAPNGKFFKSGCETIYDLIEEVIEEPVKKPHKHCELIKAWADGAKIQIKPSYSNEWEDCHNELSWNPHYEYRIKPQEVPQWRKDLAQALKDGKVVEFSVSPSTPYGWVVVTENIFESESFMDYGQEHFRIKPELKPDVVNLYRSENCQLFYEESYADASLKVIWDGETRKLKSAEVLK